MIISFNFLYISLPLTDAPSLGIFVPPEALLVSNNNNNNSSSSNRSSNVQQSGDKKEEEGRGIGIFV